jgi:hypothetical protein
MAQIDEERMLVKFSSLIRDTQLANANTVVSETIRADIENYAQNLINTTTGTSGIYIIEVSITQS